MYFLTVPGFAIVAILINNVVTMKTDVVSTDGRYALVKSHRPGNVTTYIPLNSAQDDCNAWQDKAWPISSYWLYPNDNCEGDAQQFTKCAKYGDHWDAGRFICQGAFDMTFEGQGSIKTSGGRMGVRTFLLMTHACPPMSPESGEIDELDPGNGACIRQELQNKHGITVKNVDAGGNEITGDTQWIDTDYEDGQGRRNLLKRGPTCKKFIQADDSTTESARTPPIDQGSVHGPCDDDKCTYKISKGRDVSLEWGVEFSVSSDFVFVSAETSTHFSRSWTETTQEEFTGHAKRGGSLKFVCDKPAYLLHGTYTECDDGQDHEGTILKPADGLPSCRAVHLG